MTKPKVQKWESLARLSLLLILLLLSAPALAEDMSYPERLFNQSYVHTVDLVVDNWEEFIAFAPEEKYVSCTVVIDGEAIANIGLRAKGNNSLSLIEKYGLSRYSLKIEFDHYEDKTYHGLDKLSLDTSFQDNSYMKTFVAYDMMRFMEVPTPLTSYAWVTVNGAPWGLFVAVEEIEEGFCRRVFGEDYGQLYKPDYKRLSDENADVALKYVDDSPLSYPNIFRKAKFDYTREDQSRLIEALRVLSTGENLETAVDVDEVLRYFVPQVFVVNEDSYLGRTGHNYFLYEKNGILSMLPWDYNLAFGTYNLASSEPENDATKFVNSPINTPAAGSVMLNRPMYHNLMQNKSYFQQYHAYFDHFIREYFESGYFEERVLAVSRMIAPYVQQDPTAFCNYFDHQLAVRTLTDFCLLRARSVRGQLAGEIPATIRAQREDASAFIDASGIWIPDLGEIADLKDGVK